MYNIFRCINFRVLMNFPKNIITSLLILKGAGGGGGGGVFIKIMSKSTLWLFLIEGSDIYQLLLIPWKNIVPSRNDRRSKVSACV